MAERSPTPNYAAAAWSALRALRVEKPNPMSSDAVGMTVDHSGLQPILAALADGGITTLRDTHDQIRQYTSELAAVDPDNLDRHESLAFWINLYNAGALLRAGKALASNEDSIFHSASTLSARWIAVAGRSLSLDDIEHGKIRRFGDPRIHGAIVCAAVSCPTLARTPYAGTTLDTMLDEQMRRFMRNGGATLNRDTSTLELSRIFKWFGGDFVWPASMPTLRFPRSQSIARAVEPWLDPDDVSFMRTYTPTVVFARYDWSLSCTVT